MIYDTIRNLAWGAIGVQYGYGGGGAYSRPKHVYGGSFMTLLEAMESGRNFRTAGTEAPYPYSVDRYGMLLKNGNPIANLYLMYIRDEYELEPLPEKKVEITASQFDEAVGNSMRLRQGPDRYAPPEYVLISDLKRKLGL